MSEQGLSEGFLRLLRGHAGRKLARTYDLSERGMNNIPESGPVIVASNHIGWLDGPLLIGRLPRPAHAMVKAEAWEGRSGRLLKASGQIKVDRNRNDTAAVRTAYRALRAGQVVVMYPEGARGDGEFESIRPGVAWLALATGAPVVPLAVFGTREAGAEAESKPAKGSKIHLVYGPPIRVPEQPWPRTTEMIATVSDQIHTHLREHLAWAKSVTKRELPGPLPAGSHG